MTSEPDEVKVFETFLGHNYPKFMKSFHEWIEEEGPREPDRIGVERINDVFQELFTNVIDQAAINFVADTKEDFNFVVDYIF